MRLSAACHLACHAEMASCLDVAFWKATVLGSRWLGGKGAVAVSRARLMQRWMPAIEISDGHHSMETWVFLKLERIWVIVVQNLREEDCPGWGRRLVMAWAVAVARAHRSASKSVAEKPSWRAEWPVSRLLEKEAVIADAGWRFVVPVPVGFRATGEHR